MNYESVGMGIVLILAVRGIVLFADSVDKVHAEEQEIETMQCENQCHQFEMGFFDNEDGCWCLDYVNKKSVRIR